MESLLFLLTRKGVYTSFSLKTAFTPSQKARFPLISSNFRCEGLEMEHSPPNVLRAAFPQNFNAFLCEHLRRQTFTRFPDYPCEGW